MWEEPGNEAQEIPTFMSCLIFITVAFQIWTEETRTMF